VTLTKGVTFKHGDKVREEASLPGIHKSSKRVELFRAGSMIHSFQTSVEGAAYCEAHDTKFIDNAEDILMYSGPASCPIVGGECRKFLAGEGELAVYDKEVDGEYQVVAMTMDGETLVINKMTVGAPEGVSFTAPIDCNARTPWQVAGLPRIGASEPFTTIEKKVPAHIRNLMEDTNDDQRMTEAIYHEALLNFGVEHTDLVGRNATVAGFASFADFEQALDEKMAEIEDSFYSSWTKDEDEGALPYEGEPTIEDPSLEDTMTEEDDGDIQEHLNGEDSRRALASHKPKPPSCPSPFKPNGKAWNRSCTASQNVMGTLLYPAANLRNGHAIAPSTLLGTAFQIRMFLSGISNCPSWFQAEFYLTDWLIPKTNGTQSGDTILKFGIMICHVWLRLVVKPSPYPGLAELGGSLSINFSLDFFNVSVTGCLIFGFGFAGFKKWKFRFPSMVINYNICITFAKLYHSGARCNYYNISLTVSTSVRIGVGKSWYRISALLELGGSVTFQQGVPATKPSGTTNFDCWHQMAKYYRSMCSRCARVWYPSNVVIFAVTWFSAFGFSRWSYTKSGTIVSIGLRLKKMARGNGKNSYTYRGKNEQSDTGAIYNGKSYMFSSSKSYSIRASCPSSCSRGNAHERYQEKKETW